VNATMIAMAGGRKCHVQRRIYRRTPRVRSPAAVRLPNGKPKKSTTRMLATNNAHIEQPLHGIIDAGIVGESPLRAARRSAAVGRR